MNSSFITSGRVASEIVYYAERRKLFRHCSPSWDTGKRSKEYTCTSKGRLGRTVDMSQQLARASGPQIETRTEKPPSGC